MGGTEKDDKSRASADARNPRVAAKFSTQGLKGPKTPADIKYAETISKLLTDGVNNGIEAVARDAHVGITCVAAFMPLLYRWALTALRKADDEGRHKLAAELDAMHKGKSMRAFLNLLMLFLAVSRLRVTRCTL